MYVIIMGGGRVGLALANLLIDDGHDITLIENDESLSADVAADLDALVIHGNGTSSKVLEETNHELVKQGLAISSKLINTITAGAPTIPNNYDSAGRSKKNLELSLIEENI